MNKKPIAAALGTSFAVALAASPIANAAENPFDAADVGASIMLAANMGKDMKGNDVVLPENFTYGGDNTAAYAGGKLATGAKDPAVCGTFKESSCSMDHLKGK